MQAAEKERRVLNQGLSHRLKNTLAMVLAIAAQTLKDVSDRDAVDAFSGRLHALSKGHDVLLRENWSAAAIADVMISVLTLHSDETRRDLEGPEVFFSPRQTLPYPSCFITGDNTNTVRFRTMSAAFR